MKKDSWLKIGAFLIVFLMLGVAFTVVAAQIWG
jgi:hypothetical protein